MKTKIKYKITSILSVNRDSVNKVQSAPPKQGECC